jgi:hypothetical protein
VYGAYKIIDKPFSTISDLVQDILNTPIDKYPVIQKCNEIHQDVIMVEKKEICHKTYIKDVKLPNSNGDNFLFISSNIQHGKTLEKVCHNLTLLYDTPIKADTFSWSKKDTQWKKFNQTEIELIKSIA